MATAPGTHPVATLPTGAEKLAHPEANVSIVGMESYGRAPTFLMLTGYERVRSVVAALARDLESARRVELALPATGVCSSDAVTGQSSGRESTPVVIGSRLAAPARR